ncbi:MAG TPA: RNA polymerase sigma factor [Myxococcales bacterium]|nr:RNA polymerase sigma factor [Myxococcales bacterium]
MEESELARLYEQYGYYVHRRCLALLRSASDADDATQEVFLRVQRYHRTSTAGTSRLGWLYAIAVHCCADLARRRSREPLAEDAAAPADRPGAGVDPDRQAVLGTALRRLDVRTCEIGVLHYLDGYSQEEVAAITGYSRRTVFTKLRAFEAHLRSFGFGGSTP